MICAGLEPGTCLVLRWRNAALGWRKENTTLNAEFHTLNTYHRALIATGGRKSDNSITDEIHILEEEQDWKIFDALKLKTAVYNHCAVVTNSELLWVIGGSSSTAANTNSVTVMDPQLPSSGWRDAANLPRGVSGATCVFDWIENKIYVAEG